jgi:hypothetical protein
MTSKLKFFGIYDNGYTFKDLNEEEQKEILIKNKIYIEGVINDSYNKHLVHPFYLNASQNIKFIGDDFKINNINYTLNSEFIDEVYEQILKRFENGSLLNINEYIKSTNLKFNFIESESEKNKFLNEIKKLAEKNYLEKLSDKVFQDFHKLSNENPNYKEIVIKKHLRYDITHLSDYIFGIDNIQNFLSISIYYDFLRATKIIDFCNDNFLIEDKDIDLKKPSLPKTIAMLNEIGFFELEKIKNLNDKNIARIISFIQMKDMDSITNLRAISGNIRALNPNNKEDGFKYTSHKWIDYSKEKLNEIKKGNK